MNKHIVRTCIAGQLIEAVVARKRVVKLLGIIKAVNSAYAVYSEYAR